MGAVPDVDEADDSLVALVVNDSFSDPESVHPATVAAVIAAIAMMQRLVERRFTVFSIVSCC
ncbi:hypothetical protein G9444_6623 (plasmid) [Rhodococcus erythropolis]|uniref:Uncharacterized protein n=1 Tax=Rhodococcus erythropolis TaxID=1833 RepID=A0A6G9D4H2_RHOER|nr:hypothetical protein [Rhodococcus erythropolis]EQM29716.1 hypothetical protein N601_31495 [Rhodococcus erythropolis DN1]QIP43866.1 hypothetical protein G9444_6623 [Rhodococcus erythropolis]BBE49226.1 hypothetical protein RE2895_61570 [Rhodococcus erythropolis]